MDSEPSDFNPYESPLRQESAGDTAGPRLPLALKVVAWLTIGQGFLTAIAAANSLFHGSFHLDLSVLLIPAGFGLLKLRRGWRTFTLVVIWLYLIISPLLAAFALFGPQPIEARIMGFQKGPIPDWVVIPGAIFHFLLDLWQYRVLTRWDVKALFGLHGKSVPRPDEM